VLEIIWVFEIKTHTTANGGYVSL